MSIEEWVRTARTSELKLEWQDAKASIPEARAQGRRLGAGLPPSAAMGSVGIPEVARLKREMKAIKQELKRRGEWRRGAK